MGIVLNWIVQGVMVAAAAGIGLSLLPAGRARARVRVWWTVVAVVIALPLVTWWSAALPEPLASGSRLPASGVASGVMAPLVVVPYYVWNATAVAAMGWIAWFCLQTLRLSLDLRALARARRACIPVSPSVESRLRPSTRARLAQSRARLAVSGDVRAAAVLGFAPPIIAIQPSLLLHLTDAELDQVVIHEWAHVARRDALGTLVQQVVHTLVGWHPAVWFAMGRLRMEREMACDEVVVDATGSAKAYAACLTRVATLAQTSRGSRLAVAMLSSPGLTRRVLRLLARRQAPAIAPHLMMIPAALAVVVALGSGQLSVFGVQITPLALVEARIVSATPSTVVARMADARPPARTPKPAPLPLAARDVTPTAEAVPMPEAGVQQAAATTPAAEQIEEPAPMPLASSTVPATVSQLPDVVPAATVERSTVSGEARQAWAAATQAGESIGQSSRKGAVATAGFFTRLSKKVATSF
jgi:beta-lactamase regulating signal transducer with metallopeptidase domain